MRKRLHGIPAVNYIVLSLVSMFCIFPFLWILIGSTNTAFDILQGKMTFGSELVINWNALFGKYEMAQALRNSTIITVITVVLTLLVTSMAAYGFQIYRSKWKEKVYSLFLLTMMIPFASLMIPLFKVIVKMKLLNSYAAIILVAIGSVFMIFFFRQSFSQYPMEILQAARVDGASEFRAFFSIFIPSMKSTYFAAAIYAFMASWNSYLWPLIVLQTNEKRTATLLISAMSSSYTPDYGVIMLAIVLATLPVILIFFVFQKQFVQGMLGSVKQ